MTEAIDIINYARPYFGNSTDSAVFKSIVFTFAAMIKDQNFKEDRLMPRKVH